MSQTVHHPIFARVYAQVSQKMEQSGGADHRRRLLAHLHGRVIEVGAGNGLNFPHHPTTVSTVLAVEPEAHLRSLAQDTPNGPTSRSRSWTVSRWRSPPRRTCSASRAGDQPFPGAASVLDRSLVRARFGLESRNPHSPSDTPTEGAPMLSRTRTLAAAVAVMAAGPTVAIAATSAAADPEEGGGRSMVDAGSMMDGMEEGQMMSQMPVGQMHRHMREMGMDIGQMHQQMRDAGVDVGAMHQMHGPAASPAGGG